MAGNYVVSTASILLSTIDNHEVSKSMSAITKDLVDGQLLINWLLFKLTVVHKLLKFEK